MAITSINLGKLKFRWRGAWATGTAYTRDDVVQANGNAYVCIISHTAAVFNTDLGQPYWEVMVLRGEQGPVGPASTISTSPDVDVSNLVDGSILIYDDNINKWVASTDLEQQTMDGGFY